MQKSLDFCQCRLHWHNCISYAFLHISFQEWFVAFFICFQIQSKEFTPQELVSDPRYFVKLKHVLLISSGILAMKCDKEVVVLVKNFTNEVKVSWNRFESDQFEFVWQWLLVMPLLHLLLGQSKSIKLWPIWICVSIALMMLVNIYCWRNQSQQDDNQFVFDSQSY